MIGSAQQALQPAKVDLPACLFALISVDSDEADRHDCRPWSRWASSALPSDHEDEEKTQHSADRAAIAGYTCGAWSITARPAPAAAPLPNVVNTAKNRKTSPRFLPGHGGGPTRPEKTAAKSPPVL